MYSRGPASIAEQIKSTVDEAQSIITNFYHSFPRVEDFVKSSEEMARNLGYVEDVWGRRRHLPDILLPKYTVRYKDKNKALSGDFNPFIGCADRLTTNNLINTYTEELNAAKSRAQVDKIKQKAEADGIDIINNGGFIAQAQRQCVNARIQGSAATMTKKAMVKIFNDQKLRELGFRLLIGVHDELIGECPVENKDAVADLLTYDMRTCAEDTITTVKFSCDPDLSYNWYFNDYCSVVKEEYMKLVKGNIEKNISPISEEEAFKVICEEHSELTPDNLKEVIYRDFMKEDDEDWQRRLQELRDKEDFTIYDEE